MSKAFDHLEKSEILGTLTKDEYWEMRFHQSHIENKKLKTDVVNLKQQLLMKEILLLQSKVNNMKMDINQSLGEQLIAKKEYEEIRKKISDRIGGDLKGCIIDDVTFEVTRDLEDKPALKDQASEIIMEDQQSTQP